MSHDEIRELIGAHVDSELDASHAREVEAHLRTCADCRGAEERIRGLRTALVKSAAAYRAPADLRRNISKALRRESKPERFSFSPWLVAAAAGACAVLLAGFLLLERTGAPRRSMADDVVTSHVRSLLATHLVDIASSNQHTVKPWFDGKVDFAPDVRDLAEAGFPLVGGRLDYLDNKTVVALVYQRNKHPINLFVAPVSNDAETKPERMTRRGYHLVHWIRHGMEYWAVSDLNATELDQFVAQIRA